jgi:hypothetical protein
MKKILTVTATLFCMAGFAQPVPSKGKEKPNTLSGREEAQNWKLLFDGETTKGWHSFNKAGAGAAWKVKDGELYLDTTKKEGWQTSGGGDLVTEKTYKNFDLKLEWKISAGGNSGIIFLVQEDGKHEYSWQTGPEMQIVDNEKHPDGKLVKHQAGDLYDLIAASPKAVKPAGEWNQAEIIVKDGGLTLLLNGVKVVSATLWKDGWKKLIAESKFKEMPDFGKFQSGKIALQDHGNMVSFRNIKIKEL